MKFPFAEYGRKDLLAFGVIALVAVGLCLAFAPYLLPAPILLLAFVAYFFRDPKRIVPDVANALLAPADGKVMDISEVVEDEFIKGPAYKVGIFLSVFNVHINRSPVTGKVDFLRYEEGDFKAAFHPHATRDNENNVIGIVCDNPVIGKVVVRQIAGVIARRIVCDCKVEDVIQRGQKIGMIKFGSRTELYVPKKEGVVITTKIGDKVLAGITIMGTVT
ncbi:MAG: phosphatidylserine decarboxylase family protein [Planctomycetes bacterium]|nr:phosphatidylserine decarboxylase family protein [Planctomycetota bacterium]